MGSSGPRLVHRRVDGVLPARQLTDDNLVGDLADWKETLADAKEADDVPNTYTALNDTVKVLSKRAETNLATNFPDIKANMTQVFQGPTPRKRKIPFRGPGP